MRIFLGMMSLVVALAAHAAPSVNQQEANEELAIIKRVFATAYAPAVWKNQHFGWNLETEYQKALTTVAQKTDFTTADYRRVLTDFLRSTQDYHVGVYFDTTEKSILPLQIAGSQGRYFVVYIDRAKLTEAQFPVAVGDELIEFGGRPAAEVVAELKTLIADGVESTDEYMAQYYLTRRSAQRGQAVPQGPIELKFKRKDEAGNEKIVSYQLIWEYTPEEIVWNTQQIPSSLLADTVQTSNRNFFNKQMVWSGWKEYKKFADEEQPNKPAPSPFGFGERVSWVPALGPKVWESAATDKFNAYIYKTDDGKLIGYVRIPHYMGSTAEFAEFKALMKRFEAVTDAMVIDEVHNPGGSVMYVYALMTVLYSEPSFAPQHQISLYPKEVREATDLISQLKDTKTDKDVQVAIAEGQDNMDGYPVNYEFGQFALNFAKFVVGQWKSGKSLSDLTYLWGADRLNPDKEVNYSKPILVLVNQMCFSGGDFFPAMLQDNQRAKIFGMRTAGAGGYVQEVLFPSRLGMSSFSYTGSLAQRIGKMPIENLGVTPDFPYDLTPDDFTNGFAGYKKAVNDALATMIVAPIKKP